MLLVYGQFLFAQDTLNSKQIPDSMLHIIEIGYSGSNGEMSYTGEISYTREVKWFGSYEKITYGLGAGIDLNLNIPLFLHLRYNALDFNNSKFFIGSKFGFNLTASDYIFKLNPFIGILMDDWWNITLGYAITDDSESNGVTLATSYQFKTHNRDSDFRILRLGLNADIAPWQSKNELNQFSTIGSNSGAAGAGMFFRLHFTEWFYLQSGISYHFGGFARETTVSDLVNDIGLDLGLIGNLIGSNIKFKGYSNFEFLETPILLCIGSGQVRFLTGILFDNNIGNEYAMELETPLRDIDLAPIEKIIERTIYKEYYDEEMEVYAVVGLDIDVVKHFGIGGKFLIPIENSIDVFSFRTSIYFVF